MRRFGRKASGEQTRKDMNGKLTSILAASAFSAAALLQAQDKATLDLLVSNGVITRAEADKVAKKSVQVSSKGKNAQKLAFSGRTQVQYQWLNSEDRAGNNSSVSKNGFQMRRIYFGMGADLGAGWSGSVVLDIAKTGTPGADYVEEAFISKKADVDYLKGKLDLGYKKVNFAFEENTSSGKLLTIERSIATRYFVEPQKSGYGQKGNIGFGSHYVGGYWNGEVTQIDGLSYAAAVTNSQNYNFSDDGADNSVNVWLSTAYKNKADFGDANVLSYEIGVNGGFGTGANTTSGSYAENGSIWGVNPYIKIGFRGLTLWADYLLADIEHGRLSPNGGVENAMPQGFNVGAEYKFDIGEFGAIAPTVRYSALFTNGRGVKISDAMSSAPSISSDGTDFYNNAQSIFAGVNWYIDGNNVKFQLGYEWAEFRGNPANPSADSRAYVDAVRAQMQILF